MVLQKEAHKTRPKSSQKLTWMFQCHNQPHMLPSCSIAHCVKEWGKRNFSVTSYTFNGEKWLKQKSKNQSHLLPLSKTSKECTSAIDAKSKRKQGKKGEYLVQTFKLQHSTYLWLASWWIFSLDAWAPYHIV